MNPFRSGNQHLRPRIAGFAAALALAVTLAGCGPADTGLQRDTAHRLQELVLGVSQSAATKDYVAALKTLDTLEADVVSAAGSGHVSEERRRRILTSITAVRADLHAAAEAAAAAAQAAEAKAAEEAAAAEKTKAATDAAAQEAQGAPQNTAPVVPAPVPEPAPAPEPAPEQGKGAEGKGKNKND